MKIARLHLHNYRVFEKPVDLELPSGLVGIYGPNGAGKSALLESILFALWGQARTSREEIRTAGVNGEGLVEVEFEHEGHLYLVRRSITGVSATVRAEAMADGRQVAEGARDTSRYVQSVLGMDVKAFRSSVFAEQGQVASFSAKEPGERRGLVLTLLGVTPLDAARDGARRESRQARERLEDRRSALPDRDELEQAMAGAEAELARADGLKAERESEHEAAKAEWARREQALERQRNLEHDYKELMAEGRAARGMVEASKRLVAGLEAELSELRQVESKMASLERLAAGAEEAEAMLAAASRLGDLKAAISELAPVERVDPPDEVPLRDARAGSESAAKREAELSGRLEAARAELGRVESQVARTSGLSGESSCPLCGQELGEAFDKVVAHGRAELSAAARRVEEADVELRTARAALRDRRQVERAAEEAYRRAAATWESSRDAARRRADLARQLAEAERVAGALPPLVVEGGSAVRAGDALEVISAEVTRRRGARDERNRLSGRLERRDRAKAELASERERLAAAEDEVADLGDRVRQLGFQPDELQQAEHQARAAREGALQAQERAKEAAVVAATARERLASARASLDKSCEEHRRLEELEVEVRHLGRAAELLASFRNEVVASIGPRLSTQAADLFGELTDGEYDRLEVDPDNFEIRIRDQGLAYGMDRFSGSETDLANLALRVAISDHVRFQSGGTVGLLVLDEVFGPLDEDRKARMLLALERLRGRFRQILVVTHDAAIKEQLPGAVEVVKLPGRRAEAHLV